MSSSAVQGQFTRLLQHADHPNGAAALLPLVYDELRALARERLRHERPGHTLQPTALVHEAYLRLTGGTDIEWKNSTHFFSVAAEAMRRILVEHARKRAREKRGGGWKRASLEQITDMAVASEPDQIVAVDQALDRLERQDPHLAQVVKLRFFAGLSSQQAAQALGLSGRTFRRDWSLARAWLARELGGTAFQAVRPAQDTG